MASSRAIAPPLADVLYTLAEERADEETTDLTEEMRAGLMRDGADVARRVEEEIETRGASAAHDDVDAEDLNAIRGAAGVIVTRPSARPGACRDLSQRKRAARRVEHHS